MKGGVKVYIAEQFIYKCETGLQPDVAKQIVMAAWMLHGAWVGREAGARNHAFFPGKVAAAGIERYLVCATGGGWVRPRPGVVRNVMVASMCFAYSCTLQLHGVLESLLARCNGCMDVAWRLISGESWSTKPGVFPCKEAAAHNERYLVCAAGAGWVRPRLGVVRAVMAAMCFVYFCTLQLHGVLESLLAHCNGCMDVAWGLSWAGSRTPNRAFFRVKWLPPAMKGTLCARRVRAGFGQGSE